MFSGANEPRRFASQEAHEALKRALEAMRSEMPAQLASLRGDLLDGLRSKADREDLQALRAMASQRVPAGGLDGPVAEDPAVHRVQLLPARCISCDKHVEFTAGRPHPCHGAHPYWPPREGACPLHQAAGPPPGYRQRRAPSLPALPSSPAPIMQPQSAPNGWRS
jgi:hypothetical protein